MSDQTNPLNPYQSTVDFGLDQNDAATAAEEADVAAHSISEMAKWQIFFAVLMTIGFLLMIGLLAISVVAEAPGGGAVEAATGLICVGGFCLLLYGIPAYLLWRAATTARAYVQQRQPGQFAAFAKTQLQFWRIVGILVTVVLGLYAVSIFFFVMLGTAAVMGF